MRYWPLLFTLSFLFASCGTKKSPTGEEPPPTTGGSSAAGRVLPDLTPPIAGALIAEAQTSSKISLTWDAAKDDRSDSDDVSYELYFSLFADLDSVENARAMGTRIAGPQVQLYAYVHENLTPERNYFYVTVATDKAGNAGVSSILEATTAADRSNPVASNRQLMVSAGITSATVRWQKATDDAALPSELKYRLHYSLDPTLSTVAEIENAFGQPHAHAIAVGGYTADIEQVTIDHLQPATQYYVNVIVADPSGNRSAYMRERFSTLAEPIPPDTAPPLPGSALSISAVGKSAFTLHWSNASDDRTSPSDLQYRVKRSWQNDLTSVSDFNDNGEEVIAWTSGIDSLVLSNLEPTQTYYVNVMVRDTAGNEAVYAPTSQRTVSAVHIAYADATNADLRYATDRPSGVMVHEPLDANGGTHSSIKLDRMGHLRLVYARGQTNSGNMYAMDTISGAWSTPLQVTNHAVSYPSLAVSAQNDLVTAYYRAPSAYLDLYQVSNATGSFVATPVHTAGSVGTFASLALDSAGNSHIVSYDATNLDLLYSTNASGSWQTVVLDGATTSVGQFAKIVIDSRDKLHVVYYNATSKDLMYAHNMSGSWTIASVATTGSVGQHCALAVDASDRLHVVYYDGTNTNLVYRRLDGATWSNAEIVDGQGSSETFGYSAVSVGSDGLVHVAYQNITQLDLKYAWGGRPWTIQSVDGADSSVGRWPSIAAE